MQKQKIQLNDDANNDLRIKIESSGLAEFTKRNLPTDEEVEEFEEFVEGEAKEEEIEESLNEIYQDENGNMVDVKKLTILKKHGLFFWLFSVLFFGGLIAGGAYYFYNFVYLQKGSDAAAVEFSIEGKNDLTAGEEFFYTLRYKNDSNIAIKNVKFTISYPDNFVYLDSFPLPLAEKNSVWDLDVIPAYMNGTIKIKGMLIGKEEQAGVISGSMTYTPENFSSEFKKNATLTSIIRNTGLNLEIDYMKTALIGDESEVLIRYSARDNSFIKSFRVTLEPQENFDIIDWTGDKLGEEKGVFTLVRPGVWQIDEVLPENKILPIKLKFKKKISNKQAIKISFEHAVNNGENIVFHEELLNFEVLKSDLNLSLIANGSRDDQGVDFGQTLNYSIVYNNKGDAELNDVVIMAVLESDFLDRASLADPLKGTEKGNTITWTKAEIPALEKIAQDQEGTIDFSIKVLDFKSISAKKNFEIKSYIQYSVGAKEDGTISKNEDNRSNTIINKINSDLTLSEAIRYFDEENIPVGTGPHPPKVGETTSYKVYWNISNNLHELNDLKATVKLPDHIVWNGKERTTAGAVSYDAESNSIVWNVGRLPITVYQASAEFSISVNPTEEDRNKIMVLLPGTKVTAVDAETKAELQVETKAKTSKLEDDDIAGGDGIVE